MLDFERKHPGFPLAGTFYVNREPFGGVAEATELLRWLVTHGFELGNHTNDHLPMRDMNDTEVQRQLATGEEVIKRVLPGYEVETMALPLGSMPRNARLAVQGSWKGKRYGPFRGVLLVGANPTASPFSRAFDPGGGAAHPQLARRLERRARLRVQLLDARAGTEPERPLRLGRRSTCSDRTLGRRAGRSARVSGAVACPPGLNVPSTRRACPDRGRGRDGTGAAALLGIRDTGCFLLTAYVIATADVVLLIESLSLLRAVDRWSLIATQLVVAMGVCTAAVGAHRSLPALRVTAANLGEAARVLPLMLFGTVVAIVWAYLAVLAVTVPANNADALVYHLSRVGSWVTTRGLLDSEGSDRPPQRVPAQRGGVVLALIAMDDLAGRSPSLSSWQDVPSSSRRRCPPVGLASVDERVLCRARRGEPSHGRP